MNIEHDDITMITLMTHKVLFREYKETHPSTRLHIIKETTSVHSLSFLRQLMEKTHSLALTQAIR